MITYILAAVTVILSGVVMWQRRAAHQTMDRLNEMVQSAVEGEFWEKAYDETKLSALESRFRRFLAKAAHSEQALSEERDKIKTLIADIAHQTKTPVANLLLYGELLKEAEENPGNKELVTHLNKQAEKLKFLIEMLMKTSRLENGIIKVTPGENQVQDLLEHIYEENKQKALQKKIAFTIKTYPVAAEFDFKWTKEAVFNIVDNALKYTPEGGKVELGMEEYEQFCRINITDNGMGIKEEETSKIFKRFYRSAKANAQEGVGIGLFLAREIIVRQNGYIKVHSEEGKGSLFSIFLSKSCGAGLQQLSHGNLSKL